MEINDSYFYTLLTRLPNSSSENETKNANELNQKSPRYETADKQLKTVEMHKVHANNIDDGAWAVCDKVWQLLEKPIADQNESLLNERLADIQVNNPSIPLN